MKHVFIILSSVVMLFLLTGCKPSIPGKYLSQGEMADILYEYHLAEGIVGTQSSGDTLALRAYRLNILARHDVSEAEFDSSMVYYVRHTKLLEDVYQKLSDRLNSESAAMGGDVYGVDGVALATADTANIWKSAKNFVLSPYVATNRNSFEIKADTSFHTGDRFMLDFDTQYIYQDGMRDAVVVMAVTYDNDSTEYVSSQMSASTHVHLQLDNSGRMAVKRIAGYWMLNKSSLSDYTSASTLKLLVISNVRLVRMHSPMPTGAEANDSVPTAGRDSLPKADALPGNEQLPRMDRKEKM